MARPRSRETREKISITLPKDQIEWLEGKVAELTFGSVSHGIEVCIREGQTKFGKPKSK